MFAVALLCHCETIFIQTEITLTNVLSTSHVLRIGLSQPFSDFHILYSTEKAANTKSLFTLYLTENTITQQTTTQHARASWGTGRTQKCHTEMPLCGISNPQLCLQASLIVTVIPSSCFFFFFYLFDVATVGVKLKPSDLNVLISSWLGFSGFGGVLVLQTRVPNVLGLWI